MDVGELVAGAVAGVVIGEPLKTAGQHMYRRRYGQRREMTYRWLAYQRVHECDDERNFDLNHLIPGANDLEKAVVNTSGYVASICFQSTSSETLRSEDFIRPITVDFGRAVKVLAVKVVDGRPSGVHGHESLAIHVDGNQVRFRPRTLRPYHYFTLLFLLDDEVRDLDVSCKLEDQTRSMYRARRAHSRTPRYVAEEVFYRRGL